MDAGTFVTVARPDIVVGLQGRRPRRECGQQLGSGRTITVVREALRELTMGQSTLNIWVFVADITDELLLGLDILRAYHVTVGVGRHGLRPARMKCQ
jgi:hypothetical protein